MKIVFIIESLCMGGAERVTVNLAAHWASKGWDVTVVTLASEALDFYELPPAVKRIALNLSGGNGNLLAAVFANLPRILALRRILRQLKPAVALAIMLTPNVLLALATYGNKEVVAIGSEHLHPPALPMAKHWELLRSYFYGRLNAVAALTSESSHWLELNTRARKVEVIPNHIPFPFTNQEPFLDHHIVPKERRILLAVGRLCDQKGFDLLIKVFSRLSFSFPDWILVILGEGPDREALEAQIRSAGLIDRALLPGRAGNMVDWYKASDLFVMTSRYEGFPNTLLETMVHGVPAVSFDCDTGPRDIIRHEIDGLIVPNRDLDALAVALGRLMGDESLRCRLGERAIEARERFSADLVAGLWEQLFRDARANS